MNHIGFSKGTLKPLRAASRPHGLTTEQAAEIERLRQETSPTLRPVSPGIEQMLHEIFPVLDHGFVRVVDYMGDDNSIVQAARVSYGRGTKKAQDDKNLINYLLRHHGAEPSP
jgi:thymidylate synthase (FAD)